MICNFVVFPAITYVILIYACWTASSKGSIFFSKLMLYWVDYTELLTFYTTNNLDFVLLSNYFSSYSLFLDPAKLFFNHSIPIKVFINFPILILIFYMFPLSYLPALFFHRSQKICKQLFFGVIVYAILIFVQLISYKEKGLNYSLLKSVKQIRLDIDWYNNSTLWTQLFDSNFVRKKRSKDYIKNALRYEKSHDLLLSWYSLQKAKQSGLYIKNLDKNLERIEFALLREYKIQKFYQFLPK